MRWTILALLPLLAACNGGDDEADTAPEAQADTSSMQGMQGMQGHGDDMTAQMQQHMTMMQNVDADSLAAMLPAHRQMTGNMIAQMNQQMQSMNMTADAAWTAVMDSIRDDLTRMTELSSTELKPFMAEHHRRMTRLMEMHTNMMKNMRM